MLIVKLRVKYFFNGHYLIVDVSDEDFATSPIRVHPHDYYYYYYYYCVDDDYDDEDDDSGLDFPSHYSPNLHPHHSVQYFH